jgi:twitching motility protein PilT
MAGVDALLSLSMAQGADGLALAVGEIPVLLKGGERRPLSMPPLEAAILQRFIDEVRQAGSDSSYVLETRGAQSRFDVAIDGDRRVEFRRPGETSAPSAATSARPSSESSAAEAPRAARAADRNDDRFDDVASAVDPAVTAALEALVAQALEREAMDLFLSTSSDARMRVQRALVEIPGSRCSEEAILALLRFDDRQRKVLEEHGSVDLAIELSAGRIRANVFQHQHGVGAVIRPIHRRIRTLAELGLPPDLRSLAEYADGLVLMVGPAGSGKSSTLAALIDHLNRTRTGHVVTIEDPIEFEYEHGRCLIHQRELGRHVESFAAGLRAALREGPDVILVGEMRDPETIAAALTAAETGHLVLSTLHSGGAPMAIDRIVDAFPPHQQGQVRLQLASVLRAIVTQLLLPSQRPGLLVPAIEKTVVTHAVAHAIREGRGHHIVSQIQTGRDEGMITLERSLADLVRRGEITRETARAAARNPDILRELLAS